MRKIAEKETEENLDFFVEMLSQEFQGFRLKTLVQTIKMEQTLKIKPKMLHF